MNIDEVSIDLFIILIIFFIVIVKVFSELLALIDFRDLLLILFRFFDRVINIISEIFVFSLINRDLITIVLLSTLIASIISS